MMILLSLLFAAALVYALKPLKGWRIVCKKHMSDTAARWVFKGMMGMPEGYR